MAIIRGERAATLWKTLGRQMDAPSYAFPPTTFYVLLPWGISILQMSSCQLVSLNAMGANYLSVTVHLPLFSWNGAHFFARVKEQQSRITPLKLHATLHTSNTLYQLKILYLSFLWKASEKTLANVVTGERAAIVMAASVSSFSHSCRDNYIIFMLVNRQQDQWRPQQVL